MLASERLTDLAERKRLLLAESRVNRQVFTRQWDQATEPLRRVSSNLHSAAGFKRCLAYSAPLVGFWLVRRPLVRAGFISRVFRVGRIARRLFGLWRWWASLSKK